MILDLDVDLDTLSETDRILTVFVLGLTVALLVHFVESVYKTTLVH
jgi:hypothetical protein